MVEEDSVGCAVVASEKDEDTFVLRLLLQTKFLHISFISFPPFGGYNIYDMGKGDKGAENREIISLWN